MMTIILSDSILSQLRQQARAVHPEEACGVIGGRGSEGSMVLPIANIDPAPLLRYTMDAAAMVEAIFLLRRQGMDVVALYHSHPYEAAVPSTADIAEATWSDAAYVIVGNGGAEVRAWHIARNKVYEVSIART